MTPDTAALRAREVHYSRANDPGVVIITEAERDALCDAADEVERLRKAVWASEEIDRRAGMLAGVQAERDASRTAHAALVAELREAEVEWHDAWSSVALDDNEAPVLRQVALAWLSARAVLRALLDRHAPTTGEAP